MAVLSSSTCQTELRHNNYTLEIIFTQTRHHLTPLSTNVTLIQGTKVGLVLSMGAAILDRQSHSHSHTSCGMRAQSRETKYVIEQWFECLSVMKQTKKAEVLIRWIRIDGFSLRYLNRFKMIERVGVSELSNPEFCAV